MTDNNQLQQAVLAELRWEPAVPAAHIGVTADNGVVTLSGHVDNLAQKLAAEAAALRVRGVKAVAEEIEVRLPFDASRSDAEIAAAVVERLAWDVTVPQNAIEAKVEGGWVTLTGRGRVAISEDRGRRRCAQADRRSRRFKPYNDPVAGECFASQRRDHACPASVLVLRSRDGDGNRVRRYGSPGRVGSFPA